VELQLETRGPEHGEHVVERLTSSSYTVSPL
jgi:hypothetical protein